MVACSFEFLFMNWGWVLQSSVLRQQVPEPLFRYACSRGTPFIMAAPGERDTS